MRENVSRSGKWWQYEEIFMLRKRYCIYHIYSGALRHDFYHVDGKTIYDQRISGAQGVDQQHGTGYSGEYMHHYKGSADGYLRGWRYYYVHIGGSEYSRVL